MAIRKPCYEAPHNLMRKAQMLERHIANLEYLLRHYCPIFDEDPWVKEQLEYAKASYAELDRKWREQME